MASGLIMKIYDRFENRKVEFFNDFKFNLVHDSVGSTFSFNFYFDPFDIELKELSCVTHFHEVTLEYNGEIFLTGVLTNQKFTQQSTKTLASFGGYSKPGVLEDCQIPPSIYPLQSNGLSLEQIANKLIRPFKRNYNLTMAIDPNVQSKMSSSFKNSTASATQTIKDYLTTLATQKDIIISHNEKGELYFTNANTKQKPLFEIDTTKATAPAVELSMDYNGQSMHSHITIQKSASADGGNAGSATIRNPYVIGSVYRPKVASQSSGTDNDTASAARRALGNELKSGIKLTIKTDRWIVDGKIIKPNNLITVYAPELYLYYKKDWFIESINFEGNNEKTIATINCVLPEVYNEEKVISVFRKINLHALDE